MLTPCGRQPFKFITIHLVWHWPVFCDCAVVTSAVLSMSNVCNFNITHEDDEVRVCLLETPDTLTTRSTWPAQKVWDTKVHNFKPQ